MDEGHLLDPALRYKITLLYYCSYNHMKGQDRSEITCEKLLGLSQHIQLANLTCSINELPIGNYMPFHTSQCACESEPKQICGNKQTLELIKPLVDVFDCNAKTDRMASVTLISHESFKRNITRG